MADQCAVTIPLEDLRRIQLYINTGRKSLAKIKAETGADYLLNGTLYGFTSWAPVCHLKAEGEALCRPAYTVPGYAWETGPDIAMEPLPCGEANYIACTPLIVGGKKLDKLTYDAAQGSLRGRSAIGLKAGRLAPHLLAGSAEGGTSETGDGNTGRPAGRDGKASSSGSRLALYCTRDGSGAVRTPEGLRDDLCAAGWDSAVMLDGGGSSQCDFAGAAVTSSRVVQNLILVYLKKEETPVGDVKTYSLKVSGSGAVSANFKVREFACRDGSDAVKISDDLVALLQQIRDHFGRAVNINSAYRTQAWNTKQGGAPKSQHLLGTAADIRIAGVTPLEVARYAEFLQPKAGGIGVYQSFTHVDVRAKRTRWDSRSGREVSVSGWPGYAEPTELERAVDKLAAAGVIDSPERCKRLDFTEKAVEALIIKMAAKVK